MERSGSQKVLRVLSILIIIGAVITLVGAIVLIAGYGFYAASGEAIEGYTAAEAGTLTIAGGASLLVSGVVDLIEGIFGLRAAKDEQKIMPLWILAAVGLGLAALSLVLGFVNGMDSSRLASDITSIVSSGLMFWIANNIKTQAGL